jgi:hypothetical protein
MEWNVIREAREAMIALVPLLLLSFTTTTSKL